ncbi:MAG TPA: alanine--glyoxylate aminotransferase family protein [Candidatus Polarisedimenticolia bacterium]|nr:alanine--glyoxylate aminotransferase family protein [Candidatus Polarisedimenticolia bacterium]
MVEHALRPPVRLLLGPGPSGVDPRVLSALSQTLLGHLDPAFLAIMDDVQGMLRQVFGTTNRVTLPISGTGTAGMETAFANLVEPGDRVVVCVAGYFGARMAEMVERAGGTAVRVEVPWGTPVPVERLAAALRDAGGPVKAVAIVHAETSTGVLQPLEEIVRLARDAGALVIVDAVTSLGGVPLTVDRASADGNAIDVCYSGSQKCLGAPPGLAPITFAPRALEAIAKRTRPSAAWYLDIGLLAKYWGPERVYHHTAPINMVYALREALALALAEGLDARHARHRKVWEQLCRGVEGLGLEFLVEERYRLPVLTTLRVPEGVDERAVRGRLLSEHNIEIGGGLGPLAGKIWRVGLMGYSAREENVARFLTAMRIILGKPRMSRRPPPRPA